MERGGTGGVLAEAREERFARARLPVAGGHKTSLSRGAPAVPELAASGRLRDFDFGMGIQTVCC